MKRFRSTDRGRAAGGVVLVAFAAVSLWACSSGSANNSSANTANAPATVSANKAKTYVAGTSAAVGLTFDNKGRLLYAEKNEGKIIRVARGKKTTLATLAVASDEEPGLLGLAVNKSGDVWAYYTTSQAGCPDPTRGTSTNQLKAHCIWRFRPSGGKLKPDKLIFSVAQISTTDNHDGGGLHFGPDGALYLGLGEGGENDDPHLGPDRAQSLSTPYGKILRLNPDATNEGAPGNPTTCGNADNSSQRQIVDGRIFACGLRNPYSFDWDSSGRLWLAEVGDGCDELDQVKAGVNYGWQAPRTDCSGAGAGKPLLKLSGTPAGVAVPKSKKAGSWRNDVLFGLFIDSSMKRYDTKSKKLSKVPAGSGRAGWDMVATDRYLYMSDGAHISRLKLPGA